MNELTEVPKSTALFDMATFEQMKHIADALAAGSLCPKHLRGSTVDETRANAFRIVAQAIRWGCDPFSLADESYVVGGRLAFQGKTIIAIINAQAGLAERLDFTYKGKGGDRTVTVSGRFSNEKTPRTLETVLKNHATKNQIWQSDPDQKLAYTGAIRWARRFCPELILGVLLPDEADDIATVTSGPVVAEKKDQLKRLQARLEEKVGNGDITADEATDEIERVQKVEEMTQHVAVSTAEDAEPPADYQPEDLFDRSGGGHTV